MSEQTPEGAREIMDRLETLTPETHKAMDAIRDLIDQHHMRAPIAISALTWTLADLLITSMSPPGCGATMVSRALQKIVATETGSACPPH
jgi:predicted ATPase with chaperone activity